jgi:hypothetical protein
MSTAALKPATTPIPVQLSEMEFTAKWLRVLHIGVKYCHGRGKLLERDSINALMTRPWHDERPGTNACNHADSCPTLRTGVHHMYLAAPLEAPARAEVPTGLSWCLASRLVGPLHRDAMAVLADTQRPGGQASPALQQRLPRLGEMG